MLLICAAWRPHEHHSVLGIVALWIVKYLCKQLNPDWTGSPITASSWPTYNKTLVKPWPASTQNHHRLTGAVLRRGGGREKLQSHCSQNVTSSSLGCEGFGILEICLLSHFLPHGDTSWLVSCKLWRKPVQTTVPSKNQRLTPSHWQLSHGCLLNVVTALAPSRNNFHNHG